MGKRPVSKSMWLFASLFISMSFFSCTNSVSDYVAGTDEAPAGATKEIRFSFNEEQVSTSTSPMTRADTEGKAYYAINVYKKDSVNSKKNSDGYIKYAYGLFDSTNDVSLLLEEGQKYRFECLELRNKTDTVYHDGDKFLAPFRVNEKPGELTNRFVYSSMNNNDEILCGNLSYGKEKKDTTWYPRLYTYYGETTDFDPASSNTVRINLMRSVFGLHFKITPPKDGNAVISFLNDWKINLNSDDDFYDQDEIYSFHTVKNATVDGYNGNIRLFVKWTYSNGTVKRDTVPVHITRNCVTTIEMNFQGATNSDMTLNEDNSTMGTDETVRYTVGGNKK